MRAARERIMVSLAVAWLIGLAVASALPVASWREVALLNGICLALVAGGMTLLVARGKPTTTWRNVSLILWLVASFTLALARFAWASPGTDPLNIVHAGFGRQVSVQGTISGEPDERGKGAFLTIAVTRVQFGAHGAWQQADGTAQVFALGLPSMFSPEYGDAVEVTSTLAPPTHAPPGIDADLGAGRVTILSRSGGNPLLGTLFAWRAHLAQAIAAALPAPEAALLIGILLGLKTPTLRARLPLYTATGTIHLVVTSGLKVTLVGELVAGFARRLGQRLSLPLTLASIAGYVALSGAGPAAIRAGIMGVLLVLARFFRRDYDALTALATAALIMTILSPTILWDAAFQLSAAGTLGIIVLGSRFRAPLTRWLGRFPGGATVADVVAATLAAQVGTLPIVAITFGLVSFIAPVTNLLLVPLLPLLLALGALIGGLGSVWLALGQGIAFVAWPLLRLADLVIEIGARIPGAAINAGPIPAWLIPVWILLIACIPLVWRPPQPAPDHQRKRQSRVTRLGIALAVVAALLVTSMTAAVAAPNPAVEVTFLDVGANGPATLIQLGSGQTALIDGGADGPALLQALAHAMPFWRHTLDLVILTDTRAGHLAGLLDVLRAYHVRQAADPGALHPTQDYVAWYTALQAAHIPLTRLAQGAQIQLDPSARLDVFGPPRLLDTTPTDEQDANALILRLTTPGLNILFAGDASDRALARIMDGGGDLRADVTQFCLLPNEGLLNGSAQAQLLTAAQPSLVVVAPSARQAPKPGTLAAAPTGDDPETVAGMTVWRTRDAGSVTIMSDGMGWRITAQN